jgi:hypothetical protein
MNVTVSKIAIASTRLSHFLFINHRKLSKPTIPKDVKRPSPDITYLYPHLLYLKVIINNQRLILHIIHDDNKFVIANLPKAGVAITSTIAHTK